MEMRILYNDGLGQHTQLPTPSYPHPYPHTHIPTPISPHPYPHTHIPITTLHDGTRTYYLDCTSGREGEGSVWQWFVVAACGWLDFCCWCCSVLSSLPCIKVVLVWQ
ncbi:hypothetical protein Pmani_002151 [Petrolisthes manimaculis]|uniref:Uncharacterized protein n=1 Tax=Petrolisthes manimaculis TaxID=1843537 RepID=A0AAE1URA2_9EUCA|nr:hypothetical protein Pmani_002151 [Petrolisthes manimaculis]